MTFFLSFRNSRAGILIRKIPFVYRASEDLQLTALDLATLKAAVDGRHILFGIHGYNNSEAEGKCSLHRLSQALALPSDAVFIGVLWPGDSLVGFLSYPFEKPTASYSGRYLAAFCNKQLGDAASVSFVSHSLGARVALEAIRHLDRDTRSACLMAAAIERSCLEEEYSDAFARTERLYVLASQQDWVLKQAFPVGNFFGHILAPTASPRSKALGFSGPTRAIGRTTRPWQINDADEYGHSNYLPSSDSNHGFPPDQQTLNDKVYKEAIKYVEATDFVRRAFNLERQTWPVPG
jgi:pimeloyl-ACP methyl ester carboxylesterase